eukprot:CAMPEP_0195521794 /NCGR_PEP_ID=MMETSP0794_2-20130614/19353_1 /TAXON_ID=515487 /ORGANISM="Stephanopyxis turris, Strain CCMP 815" /LENGTH=483 /DNA_ID=CAMNT_0040651415 /DNA_START=369 /DNA_END=1820 /DNA_ORIENTATION=-
MEDNPEYEKLMIDVESFLEKPDKNDVKVKEVFTESMFDQLDKRMTNVGWESVRSYWEKDFRDRNIVSEFMKDPVLGSKRLASMPDRITNTIHVSDQKYPVCRPTVINMYDGDLATTSKWWKAWEGFMFDTPLKIKTKDGIQSSTPYEMLQPIKKSKYPDITEEEERVSLPLQTMCSAIFDAILVHMMNTVSSPTVWQPLKRQMVDSLNRKKDPNTLRILDKIYRDTDVITLQEVSSAFIEEATEGSLGERYHVVSPAALDSARDQNSVILLKKTSFPNGDKSKEITTMVEDSFVEGVQVPVAKGDILAITTTDANGVSYVICSFHGDTNGLATIPVLDAIKKAIDNDSKLKNHRFIFGLDANTYETGSVKKQDVLEFGTHYTSLGLTSCWGDVPNPKNYTTFNSRTFLQPQLNKACKSTEKRLNGDVNPKDFILFYKKDFDVVETWKDNTGKKKYVEDMPFPTLDFPSDHGVLSTILEPKKKK